jgi:5-(carboxyamino)imidazole ribonucleotide mutase
LAIGDAGDKNSGLLAAQIIATSDSELTQRILKFQQNQTNTILSQPDPRVEY